VSNSDVSRLRLQADISPGNWVLEGIGPFGSGVGGLIPRGFEACARILHPALTRKGTPVRWDKVAEWSGGTVHALAQFEPIARLRRTAEGGSAPFDQTPRAGHLERPLLQHLCSTLAAHSSTPDRCWFGLWEGYGWVSGSAAMLDSTGGRSRLPPAFGQAGATAKRLRLPQRAYLLFEGPLEAAADMGWWLDGKLVDAQSPNLFWPDDRAWFVATEIDLDSTFVGGSEALIADILGDPRLEAWSSLPTDSAWATSDEVNRQVSG
jgi:hypothetical protein